MYNNIIGNKYEQVKNLDIKEIAKLIRKDLTLERLEYILETGKYLRN